ncbi:MAG: hypothetical protein RI957_1668 [Verrucomicrobiota bacterium]|jgi:hypothetical protein
MNIPESWGQRADALVASLMGACALSLTIFGLYEAYRTVDVMPFATIFILAEIGWWAWISHSFWQRWHCGHFLHAAWHVAVALPLALLSILGIISVAPATAMTPPSCAVSDRLFEHLLRSLIWWWQNA